MLLRTFCAALGLACFSLGIWVSAAVAQPEAPPPSSNATEAKLRLALQRAVMQDTLLHGSWADVVYDDPNYQITLLVDSTPAVGKAQEAAIRRIIGQFLPPAAYQITSVERLPFQDLVGAIRESLEVDPVLGGVMVTDAYYVPGPNDELFVNIIGRVAFDDQRPDIIRIANDAIARQFGPLTERVQLAKADPPPPGMMSVVIVPLSPPVASYCFSVGVAHYIRNEFAQAYCHFTSAHIESPLRIDIQYWRVASLIGMHNDLKAAAILGPVVEQSRAPGNPLVNPLVLYSLEKVQGPIRQRIVAMRDYYLCHCGTPPWLQGPVYVPPYGMRVGMYGMGPGMGMGGMGPGGMGPGTGGMNGMGGVGPCMTCR